MTKREILHKSIKAFRITIRVAREEKENNFNKALSLQNKIIDQIFLLEEIGVISYKKMFLLIDIVGKMIFK